MSRPVYLSVVPLTLQPHPLYHSSTSLFNHIHPSILPPHSPNAPILLPVTLHSSTIPTLHPHAPTAPNLWLNQLNLQTHPPSHTSTSLSKHTHPPTISGHSPTTPTFLLHLCSSSPHHRLSPPCHLPTNAHSAVILTLQPHPSFH